MLTACDLQDKNTEEVKRLYEQETLSWWIRGRREIIRQVLRGSLPPAQPIRVADIGCGAGTMLSVLQAYGPVTAVDVSPLAVRLASLRGYAHVVFGSVTSLPLASRSYGLVAVLDVLEHVDDDACAVRECARVLVRGGMLVVTVPAGPGRFGVHDVALGHRRRHDGQGLRRLVEGAGLSVERMSHFNLMLLFPAVLYRMLHRTGKHASADPLVLPGPLNAVAYSLLLGEAALLRRMCLPAGVSLVCVARKM